MFSGSDVTLSFKPKENQNFQDQEISIDDFDINLENLRNKKSPVKVYKKLDGDDIVFFGGTNGNLYEFLIKEERITQEYNISDSPIYSIGPTDYNTLIIRSGYGLHEFDILNRKKVDTFEINDKVECFVITPDGKHLITGKNKTLTKYSMKYKNKLCSWELTTKSETQIRSLMCSNNSKYLFIGCKYGYLAVFNLANANDELFHHCLKKDIYSMIITKDDQNVYITDISGNMRRMQWKKNTFSKDGYEFINAKEENIGSDFTYKVCLTKDEENLVVACNQIVRLYNIRNQIQYKFLYLSSNLFSLDFIENQNSVIVLQKNGE